jgi:hypothetical protein
MIAGPWVKAQVRRGEVGLTNTLSTIAENHFSVWIHIHPDCFKKVEEPPSDLLTNWLKTDQVCGEGSVLQVWASK